MDPTPGSNHPSGSAVKKTRAKKKKRKKPNGKSNGKTNWKGLVQELAPKVTALEEENQKLQEELEEALETQDDLERINRSLKQDLLELKRTAMGEREKVVLRNLRYFHGRVLNAQLENDKDKKTISSMCEEVSRFIKEQIGETK